MLAIPDTGNTDHLVANVAVDALRLTQDELTRLEPILAAGPQLQSTVLSEFTGPRLVGVGSRFPPPGRGRVLRGIARTSRSARGAGWTRLLVVRGFPGLPGAKLLEH